MPTLKDLTCTIELPPSHTPLPEHGTTYADAIVSTYIPTPTPATDQCFTIHLSGRNFIAPGIAMYVFIDGVYQCNRNRQGMKLRRPLDKRSLVDFRVRQKEERGEDGGMVAREWVFGKMGTASASSTVTENQGCIEVVVLRCAGPRGGKTQNMNLDGASDLPDYRSSRSRAAGFDDRGPFASFNTQTTPQYRSPYAETQRSRFSDVSPGTRPRDIAAPGFQYGSGPIPERPRAETQRELLDETASRRAPVDPVLLEKIVADAVKRGVQESRKSARSRTPRLRCRETRGNASQIPGAWPASPIPHRSKRSQGRSGPSARHDASIWDHGGSRPARSRAGTHVAWDEEPWEQQAPWDTDEHTWDTDETWARPKSNPQTERQRSRSRARTGSSRQVRSVRPAEQRSRRSGWSGSERRRPERDEWTDEVRTSSDDDDGWSRTQPRSRSHSTQDAEPDSDSTLKPSHSRSQPHRRRSHTPSRHHRRLSLLSLPHDQTYTHTQSKGWPHVPSVVITNPRFPLAAPNILPPPQPYPVQAQAAIQAQPAYPLDTQTVLPQSIAPQTILPPPSWGCATQNPRKASTVTYKTPAAFSVLGTDEPKRESASSSSWGAGEETKGSGENDEDSWEEDKDEEVKRWSGDEKAGWVDTLKGDSWGLGHEVKREVGASGWKGPADGETHGRKIPAARESRRCSSAFKPLAASKLPPTPTPTPKLMPPTTHRAFPHQKKQDSKATLSGPGTPYGHLVSRPLYLDTLEKPYAVFRFECRDARDLQRMSGDEPRDKEVEEKGWTEEWVASQEKIEKGGW